jgi:L,D-peptidoglycan transpeptidase YkuD (ErfK/YbiS/YcfS/YnhG family)
MHIQLKKNKIILGNYKAKCAVGKRGISIKKKEGDKITPRGTFLIKYVLFRKDRVSNLKTSLRKVSIKHNMGWCNDIKSKFYNKLIKFPFLFNAEKLYLKTNIYDIVIVINFNMNPVVKNKGSAIFLHIARQQYKKTEGCIAVTKKDMKLILSKVNNKSKLIIY